MRRGLSVIRVDSLLMKPPSQHDIIGSLWLTEPLPEGPCHTKKTTESTKRNGHGKTRFYATAKAEKHLFLAGKSMANKYRQ